MSTAHRLSLAAFGLLAACSADEPTVLAPPDSSWLDFGVDAGDETTTCAPGDASSDPNVVLTDRGPVRGASTSDGGVETGHSSFKGIPYAAPPIGPLRWRPPQPAPCWSEVRDATRFGSPCPQSNATGTAAVQGNEDCLLLNVWTKSADAPKRPVLVFIHGGGFTVGTAADTTYDGESIARHDFVVVTFDYRLGALGFLAHHAFDVEDEHHASGNYGLLDQVAALQWVQRNIASFGGDPSRVTIVGDESGGVSVCALVASSLTKGLFSGAIMMSGGCQARSVTDAESHGVDVAAAAGCGSAPDVAQCMRALSAEKIVSAIPAAISSAAPDSPYGVIVDGFALTGMPLDVVSAGGHRQVPVILGNTTMETSRGVPLDSAATEADYESAVAAHFPTNKDAALAKYPSSDYPSPWAAYVALTTDAYDVCPTRRIARALLDGQDLPVYRYSFAHGLDDAADAPYGAWQGVDALYLFGSLVSPTPTEAALSSTLQDAWLRFATSGDPNGGALPAWAPWDDGDPALVFDLTPAATKGLRSDQCDFWDSITP